MLSIDANLLLYYFNNASPRHDDARSRLDSIQRDEDVAIFQRDEDVAICEFILAGFYGLLRNSAVLKHPLPADEAVEAVEVIQTYRRHPRWRLIGFPTESRPLHDALWTKARAKDFAFCKLYDTCSAPTMTAQGVTEFATVNVKDFEGLRFRKVRNSLTAL